MCVKDDVYVLKLLYGFYEMLNVFCLVFIMTKPFSL
jgi:hypothetical protein